MKLDTTRRTLDIIHLLAAGEQRVEDLADHYKVTTRTIYRDLIVITKAGYNTKATEGTPARWYIDIKGKCPVCGRKTPKG